LRIYGVCVCVRARARVRACVLQEVIMQNELTFVKTF